jgi:hypothetical protein
MNDGLDTVNIVVKQEPLMKVSTIDQVVNQLRLLPQPLQRQVLQFARQLVQLNLQGNPGKRLLKFAGSISADDLNLMQQAILQDCEQLDRDNW